MALREEEIKTNNFMRENLSILTTKIATLS